MSWQLRLCAALPENSVPSTHEMAHNCNFSYKESDVPLRFMGIRYAHDICRQNTYACIKEKKKEGDGEARSLCGKAAEGV